MDRPATDADFRWYPLAGVITHLKMKKKDNNRLENDISASRFILFQSYFQRILSTKSVNIARTLSIASALVCALLAVPSAIIGMIARSTDWSFIDGYNEVIPPSEYGAILPLVLRYLTPPWISFIGDI